MSNHRIAWRAFSALTCCSVASFASAQTSLFLPATAPQSSTRSSTATATPSHAQRFVAINPAAMQGMHPGDEVQITGPNDAIYTAIYDRTEIGYGGGTIWVGHLSNYTDDYPVIISTYQGHVDGSVRLTKGELRVSGSETQALLTDTVAAGESVFRPTIDDIVRAPQDPLAEIAAELGIPATVSAPAAAGSNSQIDLLFLYSPGLLTAQGSVGAVVTRANTLVALANTIYASSNMSVTLNLVAVQPDTAGYADADDNAALSGVTNDSNIASLRNQYGADLVTLIRPFTAGYCGLAWIAGSSPAYGFSVVEDGSVGNSYCDPSSMTHELGHNMGAAHDVGTSVAQKSQIGVDGIPAYNRGFCAANSGTVMSYSSTSGCGNLVYFFSSPNLTTQCGGAACGVSIGTPYYSYNYTDGGTPATQHTGNAAGADSVTAINTTAAAISGWRASTVNATKFVALPPARLLDTRAGSTTTDGLFAGGLAVGPGGVINLTVTGRGGVPTTNVGSVVLTVTVTSPSAPGYITAWPAGSGQPLASNLNFVGRQTIANLVIAKVGSGGAVSLFNSAGSTDLIADVTGWFPNASGFSALTPARLLDTRAGSTTFDGQFQGKGTPPTGSETDLTVLGRGGVPASNVRAVVLNVTVVGADGPGYITAWPAGTAQPNVSNVNYPTNTVIPNLVIAGVGSNGQVALFNSTRTDIIADVAGSFSTSSELTLVGPARLLDTRAGSTTFDGLFQGGSAGSAIPSGGVLDLTVTGRASIPAGVGAVVLNVTAVRPTAAGYLTAWPSGEAQPRASNVNFTPEQVISNLVFAKVGSNGKVSLYNSAGSTDVVADVVGWLPVSP